MTKPKAEDLAVAFALFNEIGIIEQLAGSEFQRVLPDGLSVAGFSVLNHFHRLGKETESPLRLARAFQVTKGAMTNTLQRLAALDLVSVTPDPKDGRAKIVRVTPAGAVMRQICLERLSVSLRDVLGEFPATDMAAALPFLQRLRVYLDERRSAVD